MKNTALSMVAAFIISLLAGYWIPLLVNIKSIDSNDFSLLVLPTPKIFRANPQMDDDLVAINYRKESFLAPLISTFSACNAINICMLAEPLQTALKSSAQKTEYLYVLRKLDELKLPAELALLPLIESQYNPYALSARGAGGLWQLMPDTAREHGILEHQRFEIEPSTRAALLFLKKLHTEFGSWEFAIAAYNAGSKRMQHALNQNPMAKSIHDLSLPEETKRYVNSFHQISSTLN